MTAPTGESPHDGPLEGQGLPGAGKRYELVDRIATGGMGEVWRARDTVLGREVAVKVLKQEYADDPTFRARFADEARHAAGLHHPGIATVFDFGAHEDETPYLVMELVDGRPLNELLHGDRAIDPEQARLLALQVAEGLAVAHRAGVVHRDVKPANLLVTPDGRVKITDFGIARATGSVAYTQTGQIVGTPHYISPEQARGDTATAASDVYALGVLLFECLAGRRPFVADTPIAIALAHIRDDVPPLPEEVPPALAAVVRRCLEKDPSARYADGAALASALREAGDPHAVPPPPPAPLPAEETRVMGAPLPVAAATTTSEEPVDRVTTTKTRNRWPLYVAAAIALLVVVALLVVRPWEGEETSDGGDPEPTAETVRVRAAAYIGEPVEEVEAALGDRGLVTRTNEITNPGDREAGTVADLDPTGQVKVGSTITLDVWAEPTPDEGNSEGEGPSNGKGQDKKDKDKKDEDQGSTPGSEQPGEGNPEPPGQSEEPGPGDEGATPAPEGLENPSADPEGSLSQQ